MFDIELIHKEDFTIVFNLVYAITFLIVFFAAIRLDALRSKKPSFKLWNKIGFIIIIIYILLIGFRAYDVGTDTGNYYLFNWQLGYKSIGFELLFDWLIRIIKLMGLSFTVFLLLISFCFFYSFYRAFKNIAAYYNISVLFIIFSFISLFFVSSLSINVIRQGLSLALLVLAYSIWLKSQNITRIIFILVLSFLCHTTTVIPLSIFFFCQHFGKKFKIQYFLIIYILGIILSFANFGLLNVTPFLKDILGGDKRANYLTNQAEEYVVGFKPQFVAFNTVFLVLFYYGSKKLLKSKSEWKLQYDILFRYFLLTSFVFFMAFQMPFSDRWGLFGWIIIPLLSAPFFSMTLRNSIFKTLFVIFYGLIFLFFAFYGK
ncbi:EpsG family protein [Chryseobacterium sp.]|uniref:EpsG family protein n=1 Tax=Chryseobacterium sp. TaxID=1871047 RepID=UPI002FCBA81D